MKNFYQVSKFDNFNFHKRPAYPEYISDFTDPDEPEVVYFKTYEKAKKYFDIQESKLERKLTGKYEKYDAEYACIEKVSVDDNGDYDYEILESNDAPVNKLDGIYTKS